MKSRENEKFFQFKTTTGGTVSLTCWSSCSMPNKIICFVYLVYIENNKVRKEKQFYKSYLRGDEISGGSIYHDLIKYIFGVSCRKADQKNLLMQLKELKK